MEVLFVSHKYPPSIGGMQKQSYELITRMRQFCKVHMLIHIDEEPKWLFFLALKRRIKNILKNNPNIKAIHLNDGALASFCLWLPLITNIPVYVTLHGLDVVYPNLIYQKLIFPKFNRYRTLICVSRATRDECLKRGISPKKVTVVNNGVDCEIPFKASQKFIADFKLEHNIKSNEKILLSIGRPVRRKGFSWFISKVLPSLVNTKLILIGPYSEKDKLWNNRLSYLPSTVSKSINLFLGRPDDGMELDRLLRDKKLSDKVIRLSHISDRRKDQIFGIADLFIMPNIYVNGDMEGFGLVALEASVKSVPVLASNIEGITDAVQHDKNGWHVKHADGPKWATAIETCLSQPSQLNKIAGKFRDYTMTHYNWDQMVANYAQTMGVTKGIKYSSDRNQNLYMLTT